jgi:hypothetical protein
MKNTIEAEELEGHLSKVAPLFSSSVFNVFASKNLDFLPSGLITTNSAAIVLKDPSIPSRTVGVYFLKGKDTQNVRHKILPLLRESTLVPQQVWVPEVLNLVKDRLANKK